MPNSYAKYHYHVTGCETAKKIIDCGFIDPAFSQGRQNVVWYVSRHKVTWAIAHVIQRHSLSLVDVAIMTVINEHINMKNTNRKGIYFSDVKLSPIEMVSAAVWLQREELYVFIPRSRRRGTYR
jgi:hypothetical protein